MPGEKLYVVEIDHNPANPVFSKKVVDICSTVQNDFHDFAAILEEATKKYPEPCIDRAAYGSPAMQRTSCEEEGKGRGIFATRYIEVGELLMVEKAFATVFNNDILFTSAETQVQPVFDPKTGLTSIKSNRAMAEELLKIVIKERCS
ncbi:MAG: hypothetical protein OHK93_006324 [Ramalina farinacea]|uniref:Uncharacterized protein n=1 Tax=Ramalina farinacea TaxID=258253 RepID=A0AA43QLB3_9LECA|nr:hypothetical protein [Ramalina farinacea]